RRRHTRSKRDWSSDVCSSDLFLSPWLTGVYGLEAQLGVAVVLVVAIVGTLLVIPTGGEIPIILTLLPLGVGAGVTGALLVALPRSEERRVGEERWCGGGLRVD